MLPENNSKNKSVCRCCCFFPQSGNQNKCNGHKQRSKNIAWHLYTLPYVVFASMHPTNSPTLWWYKAKAPTTIHKAWYVCYFSRTADRQDVVKGGKGFASLFETVREQEERERSGKCKCSVRIQGWTACHHCMQVACNKQ